MVYLCLGKPNLLKHGVEADDASSDSTDEAVAGAYAIRFCVPLDFELLETHIHFAKQGLVID